MTVIQGDCLDVMPTLDADSIDVIITDPPYGLDFMGKAWDHGIPGVPFWTAALRVAKPGAHLVAFGGTRTHHRLMCALEDAGWEIRDCLMWLYGTGFPKSLAVSKAIDKAAGAERTEVVGRYQPPEMDKPWNLRNVTDERIVTLSASSRNNLDITAPATDAAKQWSGWGTALKPAWEPIILARKPLVGTVAANVQEHGTGAINIDATRVAVDPTADARQLRTMQRGQRIDDTSGQTWGMSKNAGDVPQVVRPNGRWPANLVLDEEAGALLDAQTGESRSGAPRLVRGRGGLFAPSADGVPCGPQYGDAGGASRFFYCAKASRSERGEGNNHPTVKPLALMQWLVKLVAPPGGLVLDPFVGSGTTGVAAKAEGFQFLGIEQDANYVTIANARIAA